MMWWCLSLLMCCLAFTLAEPLQPLHEPTVAYFKGWEGLTDVAANVARASNDIESALVVNSNAVDFANRITFTPVPLVIYVALYAGVPFVIMLIIQISCCLCCCCRIPRCAGLCVPNKPKVPRWKLLCPTVTYALAVLVAIIGCILSSVQYGGIQQSLLNVYNAPGQFAISGISVVQDVQNGVQAINKDITTLIDTTIPPKIETIKGVLPLLTNLNNHLQSFTPVLTTLDKAIADALVEIQAVTQYFADVGDSKNIAGSVPSAQQVQDIQQKLATIQQELNNAKAQYNSMYNQADGVITNVDAEYTSASSAIKTKVAEVVAQTKSALQDIVDGFRQAQVSFYQEPVSRAQVETYIGFLSLKIIVNLLALLWLLPGVIGLILVGFKGPCKGGSTWMKISAVLVFLLFFLHIGSFTISNTVGYVSVQACTSVDPVVRSLLDTPIEVGGGISLTNLSSILYCQGNETLVQYIAGGLTINATGIIEEQWVAIDQQASKADVKPQVQGVKDQLQNFNNISSFSSNLTQGADLNKVRQDLNYYRDNLAALQPASPAFNSLQTEVNNLNTLANMSFTVDTIQYFEPNAADYDANTYNSLTASIATITDLRNNVTRQINATIARIDNLEEIQATLTAAGNTALAILGDIKNDLDAILAKSTEIIATLADIKDMALEVAKKASGVLDVLKCAFIGDLYAAIWDNLCVATTKKLGGASAGEFLIWLGLAVALLSSLYAW
eukprot:CAMPEP_0174307140 /NCGR_PEP_ID=MMETSP0810-20121108/927_1 /TAXON_ID=73025 ORGANISM="Eutreptiella gymnastica-like, Strain CCMP1594" /NCGR_SAMPLE_ID=MMETSP0810 /ASSEMBLY_ACC=CAM_ASM_000659 /LENGTH=728 /DNA_ID=CAMNT_0015414105 /DNA_START=31 /DNA_END=2214 /DNA_ORIENTATION=-